MGKRVISFICLGIITGCQTELPQVPETVIQPIEQNDAKSNAQSSATPENTVSDSPKPSEPVVSQEKRSSRAPTQAGSLANPFGLANPFELANPFGLADPFDMQDPFKQGDPFDSNEDEDK